MNEDLWDQIHPMPSIQSPKLKINALIWSKRICKTIVVNGNAVSFSYFEKDQLLVLGEVKSRVNICRDVSQTPGEAPVEFETCIPPHFVSWIERKYLDSIAITLAKPFFITNKTWEAEITGSTFQKVGFASPLRINSCIDASWQLLPQSRNHIGGVIARAGHRPHILSTENICLTRWSYVHTK